jgi:hypothetical protein
LELVRRPAISIDRFGNVLESNPAAETMFDEELRVHMRRLVVNDAKAQSELTALYAKLRLSLDHAGVVFDAIMVRKKDRPPTFIRAAPFLGACALLIFADCSDDQKPIEDDFRKNGRATTSEPGRIAHEPSRASSARRIAPAELDPSVIGSIHNRSRRSEQSSGCRRCSAIKRIFTCISRRPIFSTSACARSRAILSSMATG